MKYTRFTVLLLVFLAFAGCTTEDPGKGGDGIDKSANLKTLGTSASDLLSSEKFTSMRVELVYVTWI
jgi:hypothetical protein